MPVHFLTGAQHYECHIAGSTAVSRHLSGTGKHHQGVQQSIKPDLLLTTLPETLFCDDTGFSLVSHLSLSPLHVKLQQVNSFLL